VDDVVADRTRGRPEATAGEKRLCEGGGHGLEIVVVLGLLRVTVGRRDPGHLRVSDRLALADGHPTAPVALADDLLAPRRGLGRRHLSERTPVDLVRGRPVVADLAWLPRVPVELLELLALGFVLVGVLCPDRRGKRPRLGSGSPAGRWPRRCCGT